MPRCLVRHAHHAVPVDNAALHSHTERSWTDAYSCLIPARAHALVHYIAAVVVCYEVFAALKLVRSSLKRLRHCRWDLPGTSAATRSHLFSVSFPNFFIACTCRVTNHMSCVACQGVHCNVTGVDLQGHLSYPSWPKSGVQT